MDERRDPLLVAWVEAVQGLVEEQDTGLGDQRLGDEQPLLLTSGQLADGPVGIAGSPDQIDHLADLAPVLMPLDRSQDRQRHPPACAFEPETHDVPGPNPQVAVERASLSQVSDPRVSPTDRLPEHGDRAAMEG